MNDKLIEHVIFANCLQNPDFLSTIEPHITEEIFSSDDIRSAMKYELEFYRKHGKIPNGVELALEFGQSARDTVRVVIEGLDKSVKEKIEDGLLYSKTLDYIKNRRFMLYLANQVESFKRGQIDMTKSLTDVSDIVGISFDVDSGIDFWKDISKTVNTVAENAERISTGWKWIDRELNGGWLSNGRSLYVFQAAANMGKSIFLGNCATNLVRQGKNVLLLTFEMSEGVYASRLISDISKIPINAITERSDETISQMEAIKENTIMGNLYIKEFPPSVKTIAQIDTFLARMQKIGRKFDAVVVDYLNLLKGSGDNSYERVRDVVEGLRALSYKYPVPFITATQINRNSNKQGSYGKVAAELDDVSESLAVSQVADVVVSIYQEDGDSQLGNIRVYLPKNRLGMKGGKTVLKINYTTLSITEDKFTTVATQRDTDDIFA
jgi:replicative DNA helicase